MTRLYSLLAWIGGGLAFLAAFWAKAQRAQRKETRGEAAEARLKTREQSQRQIHETENLRDDDLARRLDGLWNDNPNE